MATRIDAQIPPVRLDPGERQVSDLPLLPGAVDGVETVYCVQPKDVEQVLVPRSGKARVVLFVSGEGEVHCRDRVFSFSDIAAFAGTAALTIRAVSSALEYLEIRLDRAEAELSRAAELFFVRYVECETYGEAIKSAATVSRTIVPPDVVPRFCMGSVETVGPDEVAAHAHPILEQLFWGLPGNDCMVTADDAQAPFGEWALLHVPLGSRHGVKVLEGKRLHYVWMDFFRSEDDLTYIRQQHIPTSGKP